MADRLQNEITEMEKRREAFSSAVDTCENQLKDSLETLNSTVRDVIVRNAATVRREHETVVSINKEVNSKVEGFQTRVDKMNKQLDDFLDLASSLDYFDKWARNMKTKMYEVSHVMEEICSI
ncbi:hypothetical protein WA171_000080, partial [Blastocystis sp. BT1]